jgi:hypothetical protein
MGLYLFGQMHDDDNYTTKIVKQLLVSGFDRAKLTEAEAQELDAAINEESSESN